MLTTEATWQIRGFQLFEVLESGTVVPLDKVQRFPGGVVVNGTTTFSTLIAGSGQTLKSPTTNDLELPGGVGKNYKYVSFRFLQDGSTSLSPTQSGGWFITIHGLNKNEQPTGTTPPPNFFTLQLDPVSGSTKGFRPTAG